MDNERAKVLDEIGRMDTAEVARLRLRGIPQSVGMTAAARFLAHHIAEAALQRIETQRLDGTLQQRLEEVPDCPAQDALAGILREELAFTIERIRTIAAQWMHASLRLEGQAEALESRVGRVAQDAPLLVREQVEATG